MNKVGIIILNFNSTKYLRITLDSILKAKTDTAYSIGVIDNGSRDEERNACEELIENLQKANPEREIRFFDAEKNLGFSGGNNVVIRHFLTDEEITHICLLNSDVVVTDNWLDCMIEKNCDVTGPVTNAAGNEQTIQIDYEAEPDDSAIEKANMYAKKRRAYYNGSVTESDLVTFFATLIKREVIEKTGLLDERFYPGSYEDDDYCLRIIKSGYKIFIARDCFVHHFGSGSFSGLKMQERKNIGDINRKRFEDKWNCKWQDRTWKLLESCRQDIDFLLKSEGDQWPKIQVDSSIKELEKLLADWGEAIQFFTSQSSSECVSSCNYSAKQLVGMLWGKVKGKVSREKHKAVNKLTGIVHYRRNQKAAKTGMQRIENLIDDAERKGHKSICVFAPMYNKENEKDGYIQRIKAIDTACLKDMCRIYLYDEGAECSEMRFDFIDSLHGYIVFNSHNREHLDSIVYLVRKCRRTYTHSVLRFIEDRTSKELWKIFDDPDVMHFWDMHGTVPEEYELSGSPLGCELANNIEAVMAQKADVVVVVTEAMGRYLREKYPQMKARIIVVPILNKELVSASDHKKKKLSDGISIVYAGGLQPWQNIQLMQDIICATQKLYTYRIFVPDVKAFWDEWGERAKDGDIIAESKSPDELYKEYTQCDFGFVLRDASPVNYVACPTKIIEYLKFGIIPVLKSVEIGDFVKMGMQYLSYEQVKAGLRISEEEREEMVKANYQILEKLMKTYLDGIENLKKMVEA